MVEFIALDIGNVCLEITPGKCLEALGFPSGARIPMDFMLASGKLETGSISESEWLDVFQRETGRRFTDTELIDAWNRILGDEIPGIHVLLDEIADLGYRMIFFSDTSELHIAQAYRQMDLAVLVTGGVFSFEVGAGKPDRKMFEAFEAKYGRPFFYVDDKPQNIEAGRKAGWFSHQFVNAGSFRTAFMERHKNKQEI